MMISPDDPPSAESATEPDGNPLVRMIVMHWALGGAMGVLLAVALLVFDTFGLRTLLVRSDALIPGLFMLFVGFGTMFGGVVAATAVMFQKTDDDDDDHDVPPSGGLRGRISGVQPAFARAPVSRVRTF